MFPPAPAFANGLRLARLSDMPRVGVVAASAFYHSSWFGYERPYYDDFPLDTLSSYRDSFRKAVLDPDSIVLVVEDTLDRNESSKVYDSLAKAYPSFEDQIPDDLLKQGKAVVSVASFSLLPDSARHGQFQPEGDDPKLPEDPVSGRDKNPEGSKNMDKFLHPHEVEYESSLILHPSRFPHPD